MANMKECYQKNLSVVSKAIGDEVVLIPTQCDSKDKDLEKVYIIRGAGVRIWEIIDGKRPVEAINKMITREFKVKLQDVEEDVTSFFEQLKAKKFIKAAHPKRR